MDERRLVREHTGGLRFYIDKGTDKRYISVTTILGLIVPKQLQTWFKKTSQEDIDKILKESGNHGTAVHALIESDLKGDNPAISDELTPHFNKWLELKKQHEIVGEHTEMVVFSDEHGYAGAADIIGTFEGKPAVLDIKTGNSYSANTALQLSAYKYAAEAMGLGKDLGTVCVQIPRNGRKAKCLTYEHQESHFRTFLAALQVFKYHHYKTLADMSWPWMENQ